MWPFKTNPNREKKMNYRSIDPNFAVAGQLLPAEMDQLAAAGFKSIVCARPDHEDAGQPTFAEVAAAAKAKAPARSLVSIDDVGVATAFLAHDAARLITGETLYIDGGYHIID